MPSPSITDGALSWERTCSLLAVALSHGRRQDARIVTGEKRFYTTDLGTRTVRVAHPAPEPGWTRRSAACAVALQCAPSKEQIVPYSLHELTSRQLRAVNLIEGRVAMGWVTHFWPGLSDEFDLHAEGLDPITEQLDGPRILDLGLSLAASREPIPGHALLGRLPVRAGSGGGVLSSARRMWGRMPWTTSRKDAYRVHSVPVGGEGGVRNPNLPPPSRPEDDDLEVSPSLRVGIPYPEWNFWTHRFLPDHVAVQELRHQSGRDGAARGAVDVDRYFRAPTHRAVRSGLLDGADLDVDRYVAHRIDAVTGHATEPRVFRDVLPAFRDVATAVLLDGSSSLGAQQGMVFDLELRCADALSHAMRVARERHAIFTFTGNTRHRVEVRCLKDFDDRHFVVPSAEGLTTAGYTRLGAPVRHLSARLLGQPAARRLLLVLGDGLMSDEGYEGRYAWADVRHAVEEAEEAGVFVFYIALGTTRVDPLPEVFGAHRSRRILRVEELPRVLAQVHHELVAA